MKKTVAFKSPVKAPDPADAWVNDRREAPEASPPMIGGQDTSGWPATKVAAWNEELKFLESQRIAEVQPPEELMKRFTIDVPASLHMRVKIGCAQRGLKMADVLREMLEKEFPA